MLMCSRVYMHSRVREKNVYISICKKKLLHCYKFRNPLKNKDFFVSVTRYAPTTTATITVSCLRHHSLRHRT